MHSAEPEVRCGLKHDVHNVSRDPVVGWKSTLYSWMDAARGTRGAKKVAAPSDFEM
jgi:hypothetical protein